MTSITYLKKGKTDMTSFNKENFIAQFNSFKAKNEFEENFSMSLHKQVTKFNRELSVKQLAVWEKMIAPKVIVSVDTLNDENKADLMLLNNTIKKAEVKDLEFLNSLKDQIMQGRTLSKAQKYYASLIAKRIEKTEAKTTKAVETKAVETKAVETKPKTTKTKTTKTK